MYRLQWGNTWKYVTCLDSIAFLIIPFPEVRTDGGRVFGHCLKYTYDAFNCNTLEARVDACLISAELK